jgi:hypothetical protein
MISEMNDAKRTLPRRDAEIYFDLGMVVADEQQ